MDKTNMEENIKRINELYHKSQGEGLTNEEKEEQAMLRKDYVSRFRYNLRAQLDHIDFVEADETITMSKSKRHNNDDIFMNEKRNLRQTYLACRDALTEAELEDKNILITNRLFALAQYQEAEVILTYVSFGSEVQTIGLIQLLLFRREKQVFVPKVVGEEIRFYKLKTIMTLAEGYKGILEPTAAEEELTLSNIEGMKSLLIMPGTVFDENRGRIGYGKGFYDQFLKRNPQFETVALAYECQIAPSVPVLENDIRPMMIITEDRVIK